MGGVSAANPIREGRWTRPQAIDVWQKTLLGNGAELAYQRYT
jgi:hypothetical protein